MPCDHHRRRQRQITKDHSSRFCQSDRTPEHARGGRRSKTENDPRLNRLDLGLKPRTTSPHLGGIRLLMESDLSRAHPFEMLHGVGHVNFFSWNSRPPEQFIEKSAGRTDERLSFQVLLISGLFSHKHQSRSSSSFSENRLSSLLIEIAGSAVLRRLLQTVQIFSVRRLSLRFLFRRHEPSPLRVHTGHPRCKEPQP